MCDILFITNVRLVTTVSHFAYQCLQYFKLNHILFTDGVFNWTVGDHLRNVTVKTITFMATDIYNMSITVEIPVIYCGCELASQCDYQHSPGLGSMI